MATLPDDDLPRRRQGLPLLAAAGFSALVTLGAFGALGAWRDQQLDPALLAQARAAVARPPAPLPAPAPPERFLVESRRLGKNQTVAQALLAFGLDGQQVSSVVAALGDLFPFRRVRATDQLRLERRAEGSLHRLTYRQGPAEEWIVQPCQGGAWCAEKRRVELRSEVARVAVTIESSLYETLERAGEDPLLAVEAADVLAWDVDFYQDVRAGDSMKIVVEKVYADDKLLRYGEVLAAEYEGPATGKKRLFRYTDPQGRTSYFDDDGNSARRGLLKSPLKYAHVTSRYGSRFHPVLQYRRAHQGVDYGAPEGTPVWAVGDGTVAQAGWNGGCGRSVTLRHRNGLETVYCHLSRLGIGTGAHVSQKQVIGWVGRTGIATGPHLHYAVRRGGGYLNPMTLKVPRGEPVPPAWRADFQEKIAPLRQKLDAGPLAML
jgi:murein DD-endopeptidase MepM/ murein hydrolase activator NlpD